jgi:hypothetical protein
MQKTRVTDGVRTRDSWSHNPEPNERFRDVRRIHPPKRSHVISQEFRAVRTGSGKAEMPTLASIRDGGAA